MSRHRSKVPSDLPPAVLARLRKAYVETDVPVRDIDRRFGVDTRRLAEIARREGWRCGSWGMADGTNIEWTDSTKWCTACKTRHSRSDFGVDPTRGDGLAARCLASRRVKDHKPQVGRPGRRGWQVATRNGDKRQARRRINYLVEQGLLPRPDEIGCIDCGDNVFSGEHRHEYDHARGYDGKNQLYVEPVCSKCHHNREDACHGR